MTNDSIVLIVQIIAAMGVVVSVVYLAIQIHQQNQITKAQFGHYKSSIWPFSNSKAV